MGAPRGSMRFPCVDGHRFAARRGIHAGLSSRGARIGPLDALANPVWHALAGPQHDVAESTGLAARYRRSIAPFGAVPDILTPESWEALVDLVGAGGVALLVRSEIDTPDGWERRFGGTAVQMLGPESGTVDRSADHEVAFLTPADVTSMLDLVAATQPGPFAKNTIELGTYLGARRDGKLVAMAGERMRPPGLTEISAVCTDPAHRGQGLARALVRALMGRIQARGERAFLHVAIDNVTAIQLYETLGFAPIRDIQVAGLRAPQPAP
jgi:ribosomal protein S18 acetylase RimI-like enzyme